jgi:hypothetical protein
MTVSLLNTGVPCTLIRYAFHKLLRHLGILLAGVLSAMSTSRSRCRYGHITIFRPRVSLSLFIGRSIGSYWSNWSKGTWDRYISKGSSVRSLGVSSEFL